MKRNKISTNMMFNLLRKHHNFHIKDKNEFTKIEIDFSKRIFYLLLITSIAIGILTFLLQLLTNALNINLSTTIINFGLIITVIIFISSLEVILGIKYWYIIPIFVLIVSYYGALAISNKSEIKRFYLYILFCFLLYTMYNFIFPVNIIRKVNPKISIISSLVTLGTQMASHSENTIFNIITNNSLIKIKQHALNLSIPKNPSTKALFKWIVEKMI